MLGERCSRGVEDNATNTVKTYTRELCRKLGTTSPADAVARSRTVCSTQINHRGGPRPALANPGPPSARFGCQGLLVRISGLGLTLISLPLSV